MRKLEIRRPGTFGLLLAVAQPACDRAAVVVQETAGAAPTTIEPNVDASEANSGGAPSSAGASGTPSLSDGAPIAGTVVDLDTATAGVESRPQPPAPDGAGATSSAEDPPGAAGGALEPDAGAISEDDAQTDETVVEEPDEPLGPTPATETANFPFPQNRETFCGRPTQISNADVVKAYETWVEATVTADGANGFLRIKRTPSDGGLEQGSTVSEGIAYGMLISVYMDNQELFDQLWRYEQSWLDERGLMHWYINAAGTEVLGTGAASDADEDMAFALIMADRQWGGGGSLGDSYANIARDMVDKIWQHEVIDGKGLIPGDGWGGWDLMNISYFAPSYFRTFADFSGNAGWNDVVTTSYDVTEASLKPEHGNENNGLVPAWSTGDGNPVGDAFADKPSPTHYQYDSCRTPFRVGLDYCFYGNARAAAYVGKTSSFFAAIGAAGMTDGYELNGQARPEFGGHSAAFIGTAAVGALHDAQFQSFVDDAYDLVKTNSLTVGGAYYDLSWTVLSLLAMTGNFLDYTLIEPVDE